MVSCQIEGGYQIQQKGEQGDAEMESMRGGLLGAWLGSWATRNAGWVCSASQKPVTRQGAREKMA